MGDDALARAIEAALRKVMDEKGVATKADIAAMGATLERHEKKFDSLEKRLHNLEAQVRQGPTPSTPRTSTGRPSTGSISASTGRASTGSTAARQESTPKLIHCKGWAPFNCSSDNKLRKQEAEDYLAIIEAQDEDIREAIAGMGCYALNHALAVRCSPLQDIWDVARRMDERLKDMDFGIRGCEVRARVEQSSTRKRAWNVFYAKVNSLLESVDQGSFEVCTKSMSVYSLPQFNILGRVRSPNESWVWEAAGCKDLGFGPDGRKADEADADDQRPPKRHAPAETDQMQGVQSGGLEGL